MHSPSSLPQVPPAPLAACRCPPPSLSGSTWPGIPVPALPGEAVLYRVEITNLRTNTPLSRDLSASSFVYSPNNIDGGSGTTCDLYKFRVKAINAAGSSEYGGSVRKALPQCKTCIGLQHLSPIPTESLSLHINFVTCLSACLPFLPRPCSTGVGRTQSSRAPQQRRSVS